MGLLDVLNGMQNGPRGQAAPGGASGSSGGGGMSPLTMALLGLLAFKTIKHLSSGSQASNPASNPASPAAPAGGGGGLGSLLPGGLGSLLSGGGATAGSALSGGLGDLLKQFEQGGHGETAKSWVGTGPNKAISPNDLASALGSDRISALAEQSGMSRSELLSGLSQNLPELVDKLTPNGRLPTADEAARML
jgi:uncharacterized protein YidB (DUF937 family)